MAIYYKGIKCLENDIYSYLLWTGNSYTDQNKGKNISNPYLFLGSMNCEKLEDVTQSEACYNCGHLLSSNVTNYLYGYNSEYFSFRDSMDREALKVSLSPLNESVIFTPRNGITFNGYVNIVSLHTEDININENFEVDSTNCICNVPAIFSKTITCTAAITAATFNATSDKRAKTNITKAQFSALDIVKQLPINTFTYKDSNIESIGIIAQDALDIQIDNFSIVNNKTATGQDGDYMTINESKLVYILWKAIQEQDEKIKQLEAKLGGK